MSLIIKLPKIVKYLSIILWIICLTIPCFSANPGWENVPEKLKKGPGVLTDDSYVYATGFGCVSNTKSAKSYEIAQKKSLLRALQFASQFGNCNIDIKSLNGEDLLQFYIISSTLAKKERLYGTQVIRQWEKDDCSYTTIVVPKEEIRKIPCEFTDIKNVVSTYINAGKHTQSSLVFCLKYTDRYSADRRKIEIALKKKLITDGREDVAVCLPDNGFSYHKFQQVNILSIKNRTYRANSIVGNIERELMRKKDLSNWFVWTKTDLLSKLMLAQEMAPENCKPYIWLSEWANTSFSAVVAQYGSEKAMRDGTLLKIALTKKIKFLKAAGSKETQVFEHLLSQMERIPEEALFFVWSETWVKSWNSAIRILDGNPVANLVTVSLGQAIRSEPQKPPIEFTEALSLYKKLDSDEDLINVLKILFKACEKEPAAPEVYNLIGSCFRHLGQYEMALPFLWQALVLKPGFDLPLTTLGLCCEKLNLMKSAAYYYNHDAVVKSTNKWVNSSYAKFISMQKK